MGLTKPGGAGDQRCWEAGSPAPRLWDPKDSGSFTGRRPGYGSRVSSNSPLTCCSIRHRADEAAARSLTRVAALTRIHKGFSVENRPALASGRPDHALVK